MGDSTNICWGTPRVLSSELSASYCYLILLSQKIYQFGVKIPRSHNELNWTQVYLGSLSALLLFFPYCFSEALWFTPGRTCPVTYAIVCPCCVIPQRLRLCSCRSHPLSCLGRALCSLLSPAVHGSLLDALHPHPCPRPWSSLCSMIMKLVRPLQVPPGPRILCDSLFPYSCYVISPSPLIFFFQLCTDGLMVPAIQGAS